MRDEVTEHLPHAVLLNTVRAREAGFSSFFTNHAMEDFIKDLLMEESGNQFWACLSSLSAREEPIAYAITLHAPKGRVYYFNTFNPAYAQYTPATLLMRELLKNFYTSQENVFDFGRGEWPYKLRFATSAAVNMNLFVAPHNPAIIKFYQWWYGIKQVLKRSPMIYTRITKIQKGKLMRKLAWFSN